MPPRQTASDPEPGEPSPPRPPLWRTAEGRIFLAGLAGGLLLCGWLMLHFLRGDEHAHVLTATVTTNAIFGRAAGLALGFSVGLGVAPVILLNFANETVLVLLFYPLFVFSWDHLLDIRGLRRPMRRLREAVNRHQDTIRRYGLSGLFLFVFFPFWMTGPVVGAAIGYVIGLRALYTLTTVLVGTFFATCAWALLLRRVHDHVVIYSPHGPLILMVMVVLIAVIGNLLHRRPSRRGP